MQRALVFAAITFLSACQSGHGPYPSREIKLVVQASPGGLSDTVSRLMASLIEGDLGVPVVCENKPGASGALAFSFVLRRPTDGYTIAHAPIEIAMVRTLGYADVGPDDMALLCLVSKSPPVLVVQDGSPWMTFNDFVGAARQQPGRLIMANGGTGSIWHFNTLLLEQQLDVRVTHVPYGGSSGSLASLLGGHVDAVIAGAGEAAANVKAGRLRALATLAEDRSSLFPEVPTSHELGYEFGIPAWSGFFAPKGISPQISSRLEAAFRRAMESPEWLRLSREWGMESTYLPANEFEQFARGQMEFFHSEMPKLLTLER